MSFVNEVVSSADIEHFGLEEIYKRFHRVTRKYEWTVNRAEESYLIYMGYNPQDPSEKKFLFFRQGKLVMLFARSRLYESESGAPKVEWSLNEINAAESIIAGQASHAKDLYFSTLRDALRAYQVAGLHNGPVEYIVEFTF